MKTLEQFETLLSEHAPGGWSLLLVPVVFLAASVVWSAYKDVLEDAVKKALARTDLFVLTTLVLLVGAWAIHGRRMATLVALVVCAVVYVVLTFWVPQVSSGLVRRFATIAAVATVLTATSFYDAWLEGQRRASYDVAFLLPPEAVRDSDKMFTRLSNTLNAALSGVDRVRIVPTSLTPDVAQYSIHKHKALLSYKTTEGFEPKVFISHKIGEPIGKASEDRFKIMLIPFSRGSGEAGPQPMADWKMAPLVTTSAEVEAVSMRANFHLINFLAGKGIFTLTPEAQQKIWRNALRQYGDWLQLQFDDCPLVKEVDSLMGSKAPLRTDDVRRVLDQSCRSSENADPDSGKKRQLGLFSERFGFEVDE